MADKVNWEWIDTWKQEPNGLRAIYKQFGPPENIDPHGTKYGLGVEVLPPWNLPQKVLVQQAIVGAMFSRRANPNQPVEIEQIRDQALACLDAGAPLVHLHVRDEQGNDVLSPKRFHSIIDPIRKYYPDRLVCGCLVPFREGDWPKMVECLEDGLFDQTPVNCVATYIGDNVFVKPPHVMIEKARICQECNVKPMIAVYSDGDIDNAHRYLIKTGVLKKPYYWGILPALPGCSPMQNPKAMVEVLMHYVNRIKEIDPDSEITVCSAGRASSYLIILSLLLGLNIRIGMEDTVWMWPHRNDLIKNNLEQFNMFKQVIELMGREIMPAAEFKQRMGMKAPGKKHTSATL